MASKTIQRKLSEVSITAVANGYKVTLGSRPQSGIADMKWDASSIVDSLSFITVRSPSKPKPVPPSPTYTPAPSGEHVFPDFPSLVAFLKAYLKHGRGVEE